MSETIYDKQSVVDKLLSSKTEINDLTPRDEESLEEIRNRVLEEQTITQPVDIYSSSNRNYITAMDIDKSNNSLNEIIEERTQIYIKKRVRKIIKQLREERAITNNDVNVLVSVEEQELIKQQVTDDVETANYRLVAYDEVQSQKTNFSELRQTMEGLNDMNEFSAVIEKLGLQKIDKFVEYEGIVKLSLKYINYFSDIVERRKRNISTHIQSFKNKDLEKEYTNIPIIGSGTSKHFDIDKILTTLNELYLINKNMDDIELYEKYSMETNIDWALKLSHILYKLSSNGDTTTNPINKRISELTKNNLIQSLLSKQIISNKLLATLLSDKFISTNRVTVFENMWATTLTNKNLYSTRTLGEILLGITNPKLRELSKDYRKQLYSTYNGSRPSTEEYHHWNGLQVYDIDLKEWKGDVDNLKQKMFEYLTDFHWFLWICKSSSGKGIHIYTKVSPAHHIYNEVSENEYISKYWYTVSYTTKLNVVYSVLDRLSKEPNNGIDFKVDGIDVFENRYVDNTVGRITSGIRISYDAEPLVNHNFLDLHPSVFLCQTIDGKDNKSAYKQMFLRKDNWIKKNEDGTEEELNNIEKKELPNYNNTKLINTINNDLLVGDYKTFKSQQEEPNNSIDISKLISIGSDVSEVIPMDRYKINYISRYNVCNTLACIFGKDGLEIAHTLLDSKRCGNVNEINSFYSCALINKKQPSKLGLEILKQNGIIKSVDEEITKVTEENFKTKLKKEIERSLNNDSQKIDFPMRDNEYISHYSKQLNKLITGDKLNIIFSPPNTGKTQYILDLAKSGKRILLVLPYISVIKNKVETDERITSIFDCYYGSKDIKDLEYGRNAVTTFDKFSRSNVEKLSRMFDYIFIDESHLLFTSSYRIEATSNVIKKLKELFFISSNDIFAAKICLLTGTETGEVFFFNQIANVIRFNKKLHTKQMEFLICDDMLDAITRLSSKATNLLNDGYKLMIPTNKGEIYSEKIIGMIEYLLGRPVKYGYYKRSNTEQEICRLINTDNTVGDYDIIFCSNYLSVGVDINDKCEFASLYFGNFSGYEIEQFNARIRRMGIKSIFCMPTNKSDDTTNDVLLEEPNLILRISDEEQLRFLDDKSIAGAKQEFIASYDSILQRITTPGFSLLNGKIQFNIEEYELLSFEEKYNECMEHPIKVARELAKYGYDVTVSTEFDGLSLCEQEALKKMGIAAAKEEKIRKHNLLVGTYVELIRNNNHINKNGLEFTNVIEWIAKNPDSIIEDRNMEECVNVTFDVFASPQQVFVKSKEALDKMLAIAKFMIRKYSQVRALEFIYNYVDESGILKQKSFKRGISLLKLIDASNACELAQPLTATLEKMYDFCDKFESSSDYKISHQAYRTTIENWTYEYLDMLSIKVNTQFVFDKCRDSLVEMLQDVATKQTSKAGIRFAYNKLPEQNSSIVLNRRSIDTIIQTMFKLNSSLTDSNAKKIQDRNVILTAQEF